MERIGHLDLLPQLFPRVLAPPAVSKEFGAPPGWLVVTELATPELAAALGLLLGAGESESIALAVEQNCRVVLDDLRARAAAERLGIPVIGTVGILLRAKRSGLLPAVAPALAALDAAGFRVDAALQRKALRLAGEGS